MENTKDENKKDEVQVPLESTDQIIIRIPPDADRTQVVYLPDANVGASVTESSMDCNLDLEATQTDKVESKHVTFELECEPSTSRNTQNMEGASTTEEPHPKSDKSERTSPGTERLDNILNLLHRFSCNLDAIEERLTEDAGHAVILQVPQYCELGTQTTELTTLRRLRLDLATRRTNPSWHQPDSRPPCERSHHTITINGNNLPPRPAVQRQTFCGRICRSLGDFVAAFCLCLQVNKDCVFCLGFFVAFVVSASFLTAFFYRTLSFTQSVSRAIPARPDTGTPQYELAPLRFSGGYYYIYNKNQRIFP